jgi:SAM-dependent methyltransferase
LNPNAWLGVSLRRRWLDLDLQALAEGLAGRGLEIGGGHVLRRGTFRPPATAAWLSLDLHVRPRPDVIGDTQRLPLPAGAFDAVLCSEVAEYVARPAEALAEMSRVLKPGGRLLLAAPFLHRADAPNDLWRFTEAGLRRLLVEAGFEAVEVRAQGAALGVCANILRFAVMSIDRRGLRFIVATLAYLPLRLLAAADGPTARAVPALASFATGHVALALKAAQ